MKKFLLSILLVLSLISVSFATTYYVDKDSIGGACSDSNAGTSITAPWCTISKAGTTAVAADTVYIRTGTYYETLTPSNSGTTGSPITFARYGSETVILDGSEQITSWTQDSGNRYKTSVTFTPQNKFTSAGYRCTNSYGGLVLQDGAKLKYCMETSASAVDAEGKYFMDDSGGCTQSSPCTLYVYLRDIGGKGYNPNNYEMRIGKLVRLVNLTSGQDYITLDGLTIRWTQGSGVDPQSGADYLTVRNSKIYGHYITGIYFISSDNGLVELNEFWDCGHGAIELATSDSATIRRNLFKKVNHGNGYGGSAAQISYNFPYNPSNNTTVENNVLQELGSNYTNNQVGIRLAGNNNNVWHNTVYTDVGSVMFMLADGANLTLKNNILYQNGGESTINILPDAVSDGGHTITKNEFYCGISPTAQYRWNGTNYDSVSAWETASGQTGNLSSDPLFLNLSGRDFRLTYSSPAVNAGADVGVTVDYAGTTRPQKSGYDIGAYEYFGQAVVVGSGAFSISTLSTHNHQLPPACY